MLQDRINQAGPPRPGNPVRAVKPSQQVLIDIGAMYGKAPHFRRPHVLLMADLKLQVVGLLDAWVLADSGWFGACRYKIKIAYGEWVDQSHLVPGWCLRPANPTEIEQARIRGELLE